MVLLLSVTPPTFPNHPNPLIGIPTYRTRVLYVPQRPSMLPGTPRDFLHTIHTFSSRQSSSSRTNSQKREENIDRAVEIGEGLGIGGELWDRDWSTLSGGEAQRISLSVSLGVEGAEVLLLDGKPSPPHFHFLFITVGS